MRVLTKNNQLTLISVLYAFTNDTRPTAENRFTKTYINRIIIFDFQHDRRLRISNERQTTLFPRKVSTGNIHLEIVFVQLAMNIYTNKYFN